MVFQYRDQSFIEVTEDGQLKILGVTEMDAGEYSCVATNEAGSAKSKVSLQVGSKSHITLQSSTHSSRR